MRYNLDLEKLHVETTVVQPEYAEPEDLVGFDGAALMSVLYNTLTQPIQRPNTNSSPCIA